MTASLLIALVLAQSPQAPAAPVHLTHKSLVARCLDGTAIPAGDRRWQLAPGEHSLTLTTKNQPRSGRESEDPGLATIRFTLVAAHQYEVELRAPAASYASRTWKKGDWTPVVRDRTADRIVSGDVDWADGSCK
jgi:hypothetical protein